MIWQQAIVFAQLAPVLTISAYTDLRQRKVFNYIMMPSICIMILTRIWYHPLGPMYYILALMPALFYYFAALLTNQVGGGDILVAAYLGLAAGLILTLVSTINAGLFGIILYLIQAMRGNAAKEQPWVSLLWLGVGAAYIELLILQHWIPSIEILKSEGFRCGK